MGRRPGKAESCCVVVQGSDWRDTLILGAAYGYEASVDFAIQSEGQRLKHRDNGVAADNRLLLRKDRLAGLRCIRPFSEIEKACSDPYPGHKD
jgi:hypothetical protein